MSNLENYIKKCNNPTFNIILFINKIINKPQNIQWFKLYRFTNQLLDNKFQINEETRVMEINKGQWDYSYFNIAFLNNVIGNIIYCLYNGFLPYINIKSTTTNENIWEWYFEQPYVNEELEKNNLQECPIEQSVFRPMFYNIYKDDELRLWGEVYNGLIKFNDKTRSYIEKEYNELIKDNAKVLGVLCRGTDYTSIKPKCHPIQPKVEDVIKLVIEKMKEFKYDYIYLATEEKRIEKLFKDAFPNKIIVNQRAYYDEEYYKNDNIDLIGQVHFNRKNDDYYKGLEYLSSLVILSRCNGLIAGNCGGTCAALYMNNMKYEYKYIFNLGLYGIDDLY